MAVTISAAQKDELFQKFQDAGLGRLLSANKNDIVKALSSHLEKLAKANGGSKDKEAKKSSGSKESSKGDKKAKASSDEDKRKYSVVKYNDNDYPHKTGYAAADPDSIAKKAAGAILRKNNLAKSAEFTFALKSENGNTSVKFIYKNGEVSRA